MDSLRKGIITTRGTPTPHDSKAPIPTTRKSWAEKLFTIVFLAVVYHIFIY
jgi:hypothetical protein